MNAPMCDKHCTPLPCPKCIPWGGSETQGSSVVEPRVSGSIAGSSPAPEITAMCIGGPLHGEKFCALPYSFTAVIDEPPQFTCEDLEPTSPEPRSVRYIFRQWNGARGTARTPFWVLDGVTSVAAARFAREYIATGKIS